MGTEERLGRPRVLYGTPKQAPKSAWARCAHVVPAMSGALRGAQSAKYLILSGPRESRTPDPLIKSQLLYQLS